MTLKVENEEMIEKNPNYESQNNLIIYEIL